MLPTHPPQTNRNFHFDVRARGFRQPLTKSDTPGDLFTKSNHDRRCVLVAGLGNILLGDDAFGVEVAWQMQKSSLPSNVRVMDFGVRSWDLVCALGEPHKAIIFVSAVERGDSAGKVSLTKLNLAKPNQLGPAGLTLQSPDPGAILRMASAVGIKTPHVYLIGCEPRTLRSDDDRIGLSKESNEAVAKAIEMIRMLIYDLLHKSRIRRDNTRHKTTRHERKLMQTSTIGIKAGLSEETA